MKELKLNKPTSTQHDIISRAEIQQFTCAVKGVWIRWTGAQ